MTKAPTLDLKGAALERSTRVARWREEAHRNKPWMRVRAWTLTLLGLTLVGLVGLPFRALGLGPLYEGVHLTVGVLFITSLLVLALLSSILACRGPGWIPRLGLVFVLAQALTRLAQIIWPTATGELGDHFAALAGGGAIAFVLASQAAFIELPRHLLWIRGLAWALLLMAGVTLAQAGADFGLDTFLWLATLTAGATWSLAYVILVHTLRSTWHRLAHKTWALKPIGLWTSFVIYGLAWPAFAGLGYWIESPLGSGAEGRPDIQLAWSRSDLLLGDSLLLGAAFGCTMLFSLSGKSSPTRRAPHAAAEAE